MTRGSENESATEQVILHTDRFVLRPWTASDSDVDAVFDIYSRWEVQRFDTECETFEITLA